MHLGVRFFNYAIYIIDEDMCMLGHDELIKLELLLYFSILRTLMHALGVRFFKKLIVQCQHTCLGSSSEHLAIIYALGVRFFKKLRFARCMPTHNRHIMALLRMCTIVKSITNKQRLDIFYLQP